MVNQGLNAQIMMNKESFNKIVENLEKDNKTIKDDINKALKMIG